VKKALTLTFHYLSKAPEGSASLPQEIPERYTIPAERFSRIIEGVSSDRFRSVSEFGRESQGDWLILTFDDGFFSDFEVAYPILSRKNIKGTFFVTVGKMGYSHYMGLEQWREMAQSGMEIGSHGLSHRYLVSMPKEESIREIVESKERLEQALGAEVTSFAPVGGHFQRWMVDRAFHAGYRQFATMVPGRTMGGTGSFLLRRNHILAHHSSSYVDRLLQGHGETLLWNRLRYDLLRLPKVLLGMERYDRVRELWMQVLRRADGEVGH
jgi:peptidoglycan/xylan/chitin deacetylase (PgdA/CDA1 family)